ncbi:MAG: hypothetical protein IAE82_19425 [Opitutaceae bacterium]|nr:hypothetical protein [Opitutaceae bacterium]
MFRLKRVLLILGATLVVVLLGVYLARGRIAGGIVARVIAEAQARAVAGGISLSDMEPGVATLTGPLSLECEGLRGRLVVPRGVVSSGAESYSFVARRLRVRVDGLWAGRVVVSVSGGSLYKMSADGNASGEWLSDVSGEVVLDMAWREMRESIRRIEVQARKLVSTGAMDLPARVRGRARFLVRRQWFEATVYSETDGKATRIRFDREDVKRVSAGYRQPLTESEIDLVSQYPTLAPVLLLISDQAKREAAARRQADRSFPEDAFRHVYWSYLLTREFGAEFAQVVTDAHEIGATYEKGEANLRMDLANNAVGRDYALAGVAEGDVVRRVLEDVRVVRKPQ